jgi:superfamily II DNA or RNA helicase
VNFQPREWQKEAADTVVANAKQGQTSALIYACPGSGKTLGGLLISSRLIQKVKQTDTVIVVTPNLAIKSQWIARAREAFGLNLVEVKDVRRLLDDMLPLGVSGYIMSYQQAANNSNALRVFSDRHKPIVILDEVHHTAGNSEARGGNAWGVSVESAFRGASFILCTTGTPFRQGNNPIAFVHYNDMGEATATTKYPLSAAIRDGVCRPIDFQFFDGSIEWTSRGGESVRHTFADNLTKKLQRERLEAALSVDGEFPFKMIQEADAKLEFIRSQGGMDGRAGGLVVAMDTAHADAIAALLERVSGQKPVVVHNKIDEAQDLITKFNDSDDKWIVGVSMLSEGVDIPRLRVGVYATRIRAPLYFHQFCGRFSRVQESPRERSFIFLPRDTELEAICLEIDQEKYHALGEEGALRSKSSGSSNGRRRRDIEVEESDSQAVANVFGGELYSVSEIEANRTEITDFRQRHPSYRFMSDTEVYALIRSFKTAAE